MDVRPTQRIGSEMRTAMKQEFEVNYRGFGVKAICFRCEHEMVVTMSDERNSDFQCLECGNEFGVRVEKDKGSF